jgi:hypothetical protein
LSMCGHQLETLEALDSYPYVVPFGFFCNFIFVSYLEIRECSKTLASMFQKNSKV